MDDLEFHSLAYRDASGTDFEVTNLRHVHVVDLSRALPVRTPGSRDGQVNIVGFTYLATGQRHAYAESRNEHVVLLELDRDPDVVAITTQPMKLTYAVEGRPPTARYPDIWIRLASGDVRVIDVTTDLALSRPQTQGAFEATAELCRRFGWSYAVRPPLPRTFARNLLFLSGFRREIDGDLQIVTDLLQRAAGPIRFGDLVAEVGSAPACLVRPVAFHLLWSGALDADLHAQLDESTVVQVAA